MRPYMLEYSGIIKCCDGLREHLCIETFIKHLLVSLKSHSLWLFKCWIPHLAITSVLNPMFILYLNEER